MLSLFPPYAAFSILAIIAKLWMLVRYKGNYHSYTRWFKVAFISFFWINILELLSFYYPAADRVAYIFLVFYYIFAILGIGAIAGVSISAAGHMARWISITLITIIFIGIACTITPNIVLGGIEHIGFTLTRVKGRMYWIFQLILLLFVFVSIVSLSLAYLRCPDQKRRQHSKALLISLTPIFAVVPTVLFLMHIGVQVTGTIFGSFAILFFLITLMATETELAKRGPPPQHENLFKLLSAVPATREFKLASRVRRAVAAGYPTDLSKSVSIYEKTLVLETLALCEGNKSAAARLLGVSRTTLRRKVMAFGCEMNASRDDPQQVQ